MQKLSICMIVKNEEKVLERALKCVAQFADEIVIVDTGSTDNTIEIAKKYTKNIYNFDWNNDFSVARNYAFSKAESEYLMWLDADDVIDKNNIKKLQELKKHLTKDTYMLKYKVAFDQNNNCTFEFFRERIVKNCERAKFCGFIHEAITPFEDVEYLDIAIEHRKIEVKNNKNRNLNIYRQQLKNGKIFSARDMFYYAKELYYHGYCTKTISTLKKFLKMPNKFYPNIIDAYLTICDCYIIKNNLKKAKQNLLECFMLNSQNAIVCSRLAEINIRENDYKNAIFWYKNALNCSKNEKTGEFIQNDYYDFIPYLQLSFCYYKLNDLKNFVKYHNLAKKIKPNDKSILHNQKYVDEILKQNNYFDKTIN